MKKLPGFTNETILNNDIVVKRSLIFHHQYLNKQNEFEVLNFFKNKDQKIILPPISFNWDNNILVSNFKYLTDYSSLEKIKITKKIISQVSLLIFDLHNIDVSKNNIIEFKYQTFLDFFYKNIKKPLFDFQNYYNQIMKICENLQNQPKVLSHNDLVPGNILVNKVNQEAILIDYDYVMMNNKYFDIASFITETLNDKTELVDFFIAECLKNKIIIKKELSILNDCITYQDLLWTLWANWMYEQTNQEIFKEICTDKFSRLHSRKKF